MVRAGGILAAILALALGLAPAALAEFPYTSGSSAQYDTFKVGAGEVPSDLPTKGNDWKFAATPEDSSPHLANDRELNGVRGAHVVDASAAVETAWMTTTGRPDVPIAVLDSGIEWDEKNAMHDLRFKTRLNAGELPTPNHDGPALIDGVNCGEYANADDANGDNVFDLRDFACDDNVKLDDPRRVGPAGYLTPQDLLLAFSPGDDTDGNGYRDDIAGWDYLDNDNDAYDDVKYGHGTGEALNSVAEAGNGTQPEFDPDEPAPQSFAGSCPNCTFVPLRVGDSFVADVNRFAQATIYATDNRIPVVQEALGTLNNSALGRRAVEYAYRHGTTVIASAADEAAQHHNWPSNYPHTVVVNSVDKYEVTTDNKSYLQFNGCTNFSTHVTVAIPSTTCSSNATGLGAGMAGLIYSAAKNADLPGNERCTLVGGGHCQITPNEVRQLMASGELTPMVSGHESPEFTEKNLADDVDFVGAGLSCSPPLLKCTDPNRNWLQATGNRPVPSPAGTQTRSYPARLGFDQYYGYGRVNMRKAVGATIADRIPPEAEITSPDWYEQIDPGRDSVDVDGEMWARGQEYTCTLEVAPGSEPSNTDDFQEVPSSVCDGSTKRSAAFDGTVASVDVAALKERFPPGTDFSGPEPPPQTNEPVPPSGGTHQNNRPNQEPYGFTVRLRVTVVQPGPPEVILVGQDRRNLYLHRDADLLPGFPKRLPADGASSPVLVDLNGDNRNEVVFGTSDGTVHAWRRDGSSLPGWPVRGDPLPLHTGAPAHESGAVPPGLSHGAILASPAVGDIDHDGRPEVVVADFEGKVYVWNAAGKLVRKREANIAYSGKPLQPFQNVRRGKQYRTQHGFLASPVLANLDASADGRLDVIAAGMDRHVYAWHAGGAAVDGYPTMVIDRDKITAVDSATHAPTFRTDIGDRLNQGAIVDTPAVGDLDGDKKLEIVVGTNEEYPAPEDGGLNAGGTTPSGPLFDLLAEQLDLTPGNSRLYALKPAGDPGAVSLDNSIFLWRFKVGVLLTELLPVVGEGITGAPVIGKANCAGDADSPKVGVIPAIGMAYLLKPDGNSCYGKTGDKDNALSSEFAAGAGKYDSPVIAAVGHPAFGQLDPTGGPTFMAPAAGLIRALDLALNEYQAGQDMIAAWNPEAGTMRPGWPSPVNDLQFLTGPSTADIDGAPGEEVLGGTASLDMNALSPAGAPMPGWPKFTADWTVANPAIGSFGLDETDSDGRQTVVGLTRTGTVFAWQTDAPVCSPASWPRFHHDNANSGVLERDAVSPGRPTAPALTPNEISFKAPGDDLMCGTAKAYEAVSSDEPIAANFSGADPIPAPAPAEPGTTQKIDLDRAVPRFVAVRAVDEQGNVGRAIVFDRGRRSTGPGPGPGGCRDRTRPSVSVSRREIRARRRSLLVRGVARDRPCKGSRVKRLRVSIVRRAGQRCRYVTRRGRLTRRRSCRRPVLLAPARGRKRWTLRIRRARLRPGRYRVTARATDAAGNRSRVGRGNRVRFRVR